MKLALKVSPGAKRSELLGWEEDYPGVGRVLRLRIAAPPVEGKANKAVLEFLAARLGLPKSALSLLHGSSGRLKLVELPDGTDLGPLG
ncbi:MAG TPA: DUF167 domain-containing protein [Candidatus Akkermansia intestinavium]|nr:DUF167 domain-containing protein [Candidatus Akkermansia intestinavium]